MRVDAHVPRGTAEALALAVRNMLFRLRITVLFRHTEIDDVDEVRVARPRPPDEEVIRFDIAVDEVSVMNSLHARNLHAMIEHVGALSARTGKRRNGSAQHNVETAIRHRNVPFAARSCTPS